MKISIPKEAIYFVTLFSFVGGGAAYAIHLDNVENDLKAQAKQVESDMASTARKLTLDTMPPVWRNLYDQVCQFGIEGGDPADCVELVKAYVQQPRPAGQQLPTLTSDQAVLFVQSPNGHHFSRFLVPFESAPATPR